MISYIIYNTYIFNHIYIYIHIQYVIGSTSDVLRKMRLQPMDDHGKDVAETCRNHGLCNLKSGNLLCSQIDCGISRTILCWGNALVPKARCAGWKEKGHVQVLWQEPKNQQTCYLCDNLGAKKLVQLLKTLSKSANTLRLQKLTSNFLSLPTSGSLSIDWVCSCQPYSFRIIYVQECQHVLRQRSKTPSSWVVGIISFPQKMQEQNMNTLWHQRSTTSALGNQRGFWIQEGMIRKPTYVNRKPNNGNQTRIKQ